MKVRKTYQLLGPFLELLTYVEANGVKVKVEFTGHSLRPRIPGKFTTEDPEVIRAMDISKSNNVTYRCINTETIGEEDAHVMDPEQKETGQETGEDFTQVPGITTIQAAKEYLIANIPGMTHSKLPNGEAVKRIASENKIVFVDLK